MNEYLQDEREIKGYIDIQYSNINTDYGTFHDYPTTAPISFPDNVLSSNSIKVVKNYASLENNYFLLDGSFVLPDYNYSTASGAHGNTDSGYITNEILDEYSFYQAFDTSNLKNMRGITLYFKDNIPSTIDIIITYGTNNTLNFNITDNSKSVVQIDFENEYLVNQIDYEFSNMQYSDRRFRLAFIEGGLGDVLTKENGFLISFTTIENMGEFNLETPSNECNIELYDEENKFDLTNPKGYADLLNENVRVQPYIGILTSNNGVVYINKGTYYLNNWKNNDNKITLSCSDYLNKLKTIYDYPTIGTVANSGNLEVYYRMLSYQSDLENYIDIEATGFSDFAEGRLGNEYFDDSYVDVNNLFDYLNSLVVWTNTPYVTSCLYCDTARGNMKDNLSVTGPIYDNVYEDTLTLDTSLLSKPIYTIKEKLKSILIKKYSKNASNELVTTDYITTYDVNGKSIEINNKFFKEYSYSGTFAATLNERCALISQKIKSEYKKYDISIRYIGDPNITPNMIVPIETQYGNKQVKVLKHTLTFNGGLTGTIEGVGD